MPTTTTPTHYPRLPELPPRLPEETAESYGLRALAFVVATDVTATLSDDALHLADHVFAVVVSNPQLLATAAERLGRCQANIRAALRARAEATAPAAPGAATAAGKPMIGPGAPLQPQPRVQPPAGTAALPPVAAPQPAPVAQPAAKPAPVAPVRPQPAPREAFAF